ncbi:MAG: hypothetical protein R2710_18760 [Acidimicrobiales bacterium]
MARWVNPALRQDVIWCQLFSEPDAGRTPPVSRPEAITSTVVGSSTVRRWRTSGAHVAGMGFATVRTDPDVPKHDGITTDGHRHARRGRGGFGRQDDHR